MDGVDEEELAPFTLWRRWESEPHPYVFFNGDHMVYHVHALPLRLIPLVWNFRQLNNTAEKLYIQQMVQRLLGYIRISEDETHVITEVFSASQRFISNTEKPYDDSRVILDDITHAQELFLSEMPLRETIVRNMALKENFFRMINCSELKITLFLVGKPDSSKSLAKTIMADAIQGQASHSTLFHSLKQVHLGLFQCSPHCTPHGIMNTFKQCARFQQGKDLQQYVSVVVLDEVGLAEDSPKMSLKALHPLLEYGCIEDSLVQDRVRGYFAPFAKAYETVCSRQNKEFFGLHNYYSLIKMVFATARASNKKPSPQDIAQAVLQNFRGKDDIPALDIFMASLPEAGCVGEYYIYLGDQMYVDLGLGTHHVKCRVHLDFYLLVIEEKNVVYDQFPMPLINRLEKHYLDLSSVLQGWQKNVM
ncbi:Hypothetical predicted protein [Marmota monax]|uniref:Uncharacterized protein n=1 Tax=Marmota monax TaxID=9995 RepID=A0A5E4CM77_MARMO|nr:Hypothetical predicted protein [Marmota monax]